MDLLLLVLGQYRLAQLTKPRSLCHPVEEHDRNVGGKLESMSGHMLSIFLKKWVSKFSDNYKFHIVFFCHMLGCCPESKQSSGIKHKEWYYGMEERQKQLLLYSSSTQKDSRKIIEIKAKFNNDCLTQGSPFDQYCF